MAWVDLAATTLENEHVALRPVAEEDREGLCAIALDPDIWKYFVVNIRTTADFGLFFDQALADRAAGLRVAYHITDKSTGLPAGSMSFGNIAEHDGRLEIGWSWLGAAFQGRGVNHWAKFLMLRHAFEVLGAERVEFKTDALNLKARQGLRNVGATEEGTLRSFNPMPYGQRRNAVFYSVLKDEWPAVRELLAAGKKATAVGGA